MILSLGIDSSRLFNRLSTGVLLVLALTPNLLSGQNDPVLSWQGELRPRLLAREPVGGQWDHWISMRTRLGLDVRMEPGLGWFVQVQDVRFWGEETSHRDRSADAVDFHQAYLEVDDIPGMGGLIRAGRQEVSLAEGRFIAAPNWGQAGQSFDGVRWVRPLDQGHLDLVYLRLREGSSPNHDNSADFLAAWLGFPLNDVGSLDLLAIHDRTGDAASTGQSTIGPLWKSEFGAFSFRVQGMYQFGTREGMDVSAFMLAAQSTLAVLEGKGTVTLWYDHLSGDSDRWDNETGAFSTLFGGRHRYYGRSDYFRDIPTDTGGLGLQDAALKFAFAPGPHFSLNLDFHTFRTAQNGGLSSRHLAEEVDLWIKHRFRNAVGLEVGYSLIRAGTAMEELELLQGTGNTVYFMASTHF